MADLLSIGEFARRTGLTSSALRFYDDSGVLRPTAVDEGTGYRRYTWAQVETAELLRECRRLGMPLALVRQVLAVPEHAEGLVHSFWDEAQADFESRAEAVAELTRRLKERQTVSRGVWELDGAELAMAARQVVPAAAAGPEEPVVLRSVLLEGGEDLRLVATDRHRLAIRDVVASWTEGEAEAISLVPAAALAEAADHVPAGRVRVELSVRSVRLTSGDWVRELEAADEQYPPYRNLITDDHDVSALVEVAALASVLEAMEDEPAVIVEVAAGGLTVKVPDAPATSQVPAEVTGRSVRVGFNPRYLLDALHGAEGPEALIQGSTAVAPFLVRSASTGAFTTRIMPIKLRDRTGTAGR